MDEKEDEEIAIDAKKSKISSISENSSSEFSIDFSKIKNLFKSDKKSTKIEDVENQRFSGCPRQSLGNFRDTSKIKDFAVQKIQEFSRTGNAKHFLVEEKPAESPKESSPNKDDEEIAIDFGKIKNFFKSEDEKENAVKEDKKDEDELTIDFGKIKRFFKPDEKNISKEEEITINWSKAIDFFKKYGIVFIVLIPIILAIYVRMLSGFLLFADDLARNNIANLIASDLRADIGQKYPNLPDANKNAILEPELNSALRSSTYTFKTGQYAGQTMDIPEQIKQNADFFKSFFQDEKGKNYMPDIDPYYWLRYVGNIVKHGHPGDILKEGQPFDNHQLAPVGRFVHADAFHIYFLAYFYRVLHSFGSLVGYEISLMRSIMYYPVFVAALSVLLVFLIARRIAGNIGGFFAGLIMAVTPAFLGRTLFGHADSDAWVVFFPLVITWLFVETIEAKNTLRIIIITLLAGFFTGLYPLAWSGWWHIFDFLLITIVITFLYIVFIKFNEIRRNLKLIVSDTTLRNIIIIGFVYFFSTAIFAISFSGWEEFSSSFLGPLSFPSIKAPVTPYLWPNVLTTVAELNEGSINEIVNSIGGPFFFFISLVGLIVSVSRSGGLKKFDFIYIIGSVIFYAILLIKFGNRPALYQTISVFTLLTWIILPILIRLVISLYKKDSSYDFKLAILLSLWIISTIFASIKGIRFTLLLAPAFSVVFGVALGKVYYYLLNLSTKELKIYKAIGSSILIVLILLIYINPVRSAIGAARSDTPLINDDWYNTLTSIKQNSKEDAIITSWWDFGHHFKALADRPVTFDGTTQTDAAAHWVGRFFMTNNELEAFGIIRMLDCGHNNATAVLSKINNDLIKSIKIVKEIILLDREKARQRLVQYGLKPEQINEVLAYSHCNSPPEAFIIASEDMIGKSGVWAHFGSWNFERADIWFNARKMPQEKAVEYMMNKFNYTKEKAENIYFEIQSITSDRAANDWVAPWPGYGGTISCSKNKQGVFICNNGLQINYSTFDIFGVGQQGIIRPKLASFTTKDGLIKKEFNGSTLDLGVTIIPVSENELQVVLSSKELTGSMFTRMFYMRGHGLKYFNLFNHQRGLTGTNIYTYKVDWEGKNTTIVQDYVDILTKVSEQERKIEKEVTISNEINETNETNAVNSS